MPPPPDYEHGHRDGNGYGGDYKVQEGALMSQRGSRSVPVYGGDEKVAGYAGM